MTAKLYIEGGGASRALRARFREGWSDFFEAAGLAKRKTKIIQGGSRESTFKRFKIEAQTNSKAILLVDSERPVQTNHSVWQHLNSSDGWHCPASVSSNQAFLMVQFMETWFLADQDALRRFFGARFNVNAIGKWQQLEDVPKADVLAALRLATRRCKNPYAKGEVSFRLLGQVNPANVEAACPHAKAFLNQLRRL